jgi:hypothetical protein
MKDLIDLIVERQRAINAALSYLLSAALALFLGWHIAVMTADEAGWSEVRVHVAEARQ